MPDYASEFDRFDELSDDELLSILGASTLSDDEKIAAAVDAYAPQDISDRLDSEGLFGRYRVVDLVTRGREALDRIVEERREDLRRTLCPAYGKAAEKELVLGASPIVGEELAKWLAHSGEPVTAGIAGAILLVRFGLDKLCEGFSESDGGSARE